jgi:hypothetical protein
LGADVVRLNGAGRQEREDDGNRERSSDHGHLLGVPRLVTQKVPTQPQIALPRQRRNTALEGQGRPARS